MACQANLLSIWCFKSPSFPDPNLRRVQPNIVVVSPSNVGAVNLRMSLIVATTSYLNHDCSELLFLHDKSKPTLTPTPAYMQVFPPRFPTYSTSANASYASSANKGATTILHIFGIEPARGLVQKNQGLLILLFLLLSLPLPLPLASACPSFLHRHLHQLQTLQALWSLLLLFLRRYLHLHLLLHSLLPQVTSLSFLAHPVTSILSFNLHQPRISQPLHQPLYHRGRLKSSQRGMQT